MSLLETLMRRTLALALAGGALGVTALTVTAAGPALAAIGADSAATAVDGRVAKIKGALSGLVSDKTLTQAQADKVAQTLADAKVGPGGRGHGPGGRGLGDLTTAAAALGMTPAELRTALQGGKTLAAIAADKGVPVDTLITKLVDAAKAHLAQEVTDGELTQGEADARIATLKARITERVNTVRPARPGHGPGDRDRNKDDKGDKDNKDGNAATPTPTPTA